MKIEKLKFKDDNPRYIDNEDFQTLIKSVEEFTNMMPLRPIVYDPVTMEVLGGNMRLKALIHLGYKEVPKEWLKSAEGLSEDEKARFVIMDNVASGKWDWKVVKEKWDIEVVKTWGVDIPDWVLQDAQFQTNVTPETNYNDVTKENIDKKAEELGTRFKDSESEFISLACPHCLETFKIKKDELRDK